MITATHTVFINGKAERLSVKKIAGEFPYILADDENGFVLCDKCGSAELTIQSLYPGDKTLMLECDDCKQTYELEKLP